ncbi:MAG: diaminopimelate epimerase [Archaeoglobaceae archaeon]|nr:diaminopimelate epimerase [Archaeoglobaceae archaeon]
MFPETVKITKMHGNGNDFVLVDEFKSEIIPEKLKPNFVKAICHRRFGVGADGVLFVQPSIVANARFRYFNNDGSEAEMCGNGIRCFTRFVVEEGYAEGNFIKIETLAGILNLEVDKSGWWVKVDMGEIKTRREDIPAIKEVWGLKKKVGDQEFVLYAVNSGVPHVVIFVGDLDFNIVEVARVVRYDEIFPQGTNVNFVKVLSINKLKIRTYERGVEDETLSCGTGSVAAAYVANKLGLTSNNVDVITKGGVLKIELKNGKAYMIGTANRVFEGYVNLKELHDF